MFPVPSHGCLNFHRNTDFPWRNDLPRIASGQEAYLVYAAHCAELLGEVATPREAAALVVAHLPSRRPTTLSTAGPAPGSSTSSPG
ncbi:DUF6193 family natural product biosynthesis protein [Streptomyces sp. NBC_00683]